MVKGLPLFCCLTFFHYLVACQSRPAEPLLENVDDRLKQPATQQERGPEEDENDEVENDEDSSKPPQKSEKLSEELEFPKYFEKRDLDRFLIERETIWKPYDSAQAPLIRDFHFVQRSFSSKLTIDPRTEAALKDRMLEDERKAHWVFLQGLKELMDRLADSKNPLLLEQRKQLMAEHFRSLAFIAKTLDGSQKSERYKPILKRVYKMLAERHLMRRVSGD